MTATQGKPAERGQRARTSRRSANAGSSLLQTAERPLLVQLGAMLVARDKLLDAARPYRTRKSATRDLSRRMRGFEQRGLRGRDELRRELERRREGVVRMIRRERDSAGT
jgi:hypothetical protein